MEKVIRLRFSSWFYTILQQGSGSGGKIPDPGLTQKVRIQPDRNPHPQPWVPVLMLRTYVAFLIASILPCCESGAFWCGSWSHLYNLGANPMLTYPSNGPIFNNQIGADPHSVLGRKKVILLICEFRLRNRGCASRALCNSFWILTRRRRRRVPFPYPGARGEAAFSLFFSCIMELSCNFF